MIIFQLAQQTGQSQTTNPFPNQVTDFNQAISQLRRTNGLSTSAPTENCTAELQSQLNALRRFFNNNPVLEQAIARYNPVGVRMSEEEARRIFRIHGADTSGLHLYGVAVRNANILVLTNATQTNPERGEETARHELMHGIGHMLRHDQMTYNQNGQSTRTRIPHAFEEAITNYVAAGTFGEERNRPMTYPLHTGAMLIVERVAGRETLQNAILNGNFTQVQQRLDGRLGAGTFERMMTQFQNSNPAGAYLALSQAITNDPELMRIYSDPRMMRMISTLEQLRTRQQQQVSHT